MVPLQTSCADRSSRAEGAGKALDCGQGAHCGDAALWGLPGFSDREAGAAGSAHPLPPRAPGLGTNYSE